MSPVFGHGHLRLYLLSLLDESPKHGYELIQALEERFGGTYVPSAGTIYPRLGKLEEEGLVTKSADGRKTVYAITDAGRAELRGLLERGPVDARLARQQCAATRAPDDAFDVGAREIAEVMGGRHIGDVEVHLACLQLNRTRIDLVNRTD